MADEGGSAAIPPEAAQSSSQGDEESGLIEPATFAAANHRRNADIAAIMNAQAAFECPQGYERYPIAKRDASRSPIYTYGVRVVSTAPVTKKGATVCGRFYFMFSKECRNSKTYIKISNKNPAVTTPNFQVNVRRRT